MGDAKSNEKRDDHVSAGESDDFGPLSVLSELSCKEQTLLGVLISTVVGLTILMSIILWISSLGAYRRVIDTTQLLQPHPVSERSNTAPLRLVFFLNGGNVSANPNDFASFDVAPQTWCLHGLAHAAWARLKRDAVPSDHLRVYNGSGMQLSGLDQARDGDWLYLVPVDEIFFWPPVAVGHETTVWDVLDGDGAPLRLRTLSLEPRVFALDRFVTAAEAAAVVAETEGAMERSRVLDVTEAAGSHDAVSAVRTSTQAWLSWLSWIGWTLDARSASLVRMPQSSLERLQVLRYHPQEYYHAHHDYFSPLLYEDRTDLLHGRNRLATVLMYFSDVEAGGETVFPRAGPTGAGRGPLAVFDDCRTGLLVRPSAGAAVLFYSMEAEGHMDGGSLDIMSLHGACPVRAGVKRAANSWFWNRRELQF